MSIPLHILQCLQKHLCNLIKLLFLLDIWLILKLVFCLVLRFLYRLVMKLIGRFIQRQSMVTALSLVIVRRKPDFLLICLLIILAVFGFLIRLLSTPALFLM